MPYRLSLAVGRALVIAFLSIVLWLPERAGYQG
jgi:hypothetical protein